MMTTTSPPMTRQSPREERKLDAEHDEPRSLVEHLAELRTRVIRILVAVVVGAVISLPLQKTWLRILVKPCIRYTGKLKYLSPPEPFFIQLKIALVVGLLIVLPYVVWQVWQFVAPALYRREQKWVMRLSGFSLGLFWVGVVFAYGVAVPVAMKFFTAFAGTELLESSITLGNYIGFVSMMLLAFGFVFQLPLVLIFLMKTGLVPRERLRKNRGPVIVILTIVGAVVTPTGDALSLAIMVVPLWLLFELSLALTRGIQAEQSGRTMGAAAVEPPPKPLEIPDSSSDPSHTASESEGNPLQGS